MFTKRALLVLGLVAIRATVWTGPILTLGQALAGDNLTSYPIKYIEGNPFTGNYVMATGLALSEDNSFRSFFTDTACKCRNACWVSPSCLALSIEIIDAQIQCRLASIRPQDSQLLISNTSTYIFKIVSVDHIVYGIQPDNLLYLVPNHRAVWQNAKNFCAKIPGHRLGIFHYEDQYNVLMQMVADTGLQIWADLASNNFNPMWGDGTLVSDTPASNVIQIFMDGGANDKFRAVQSIKFADIYPHYSTNFMCQANPLELNW